MSPPILPDVPLSVLKPAVGNKAGCELGFHAFDRGRCIYCGHVRPVSRSQQRREKRAVLYRRHYRQLMRTASMDYRRHMSAGTLHDREIAAAFLITAVMWRKLSQGVLPEVRR